MSTKRLPYILVLVAVFAAATISLQQAVATKAAGPKGIPQSSSLGQTAGSVKADKFDGQKEADRSFDQIEMVRSSRGLHTTPLLGASCLDDECVYRLPSGQWVK